MFLLGAAESRATATGDIRYYGLSIKPHIKPVMTFFKETQPDLRAKSKHEKIGQVTTSLKSLVMCMNKSIHTRLPFKGYHYLPVYVDSLPFPFHDYQIKMGIFLPWSYNIGNHFW